MILRLILAGFATSMMGLELPSVRDATCWAESGRAWATAKLADPTTPVVRVEPETATDPAGAALAFRSAMEDTVAVFVNDRVTCGDLPSGDAYCEVFGYEVVAPLADVTDAVIVAVTERAVTCGHAPSGDAYCEVFGRDVAATSATDLTDGEGRVAEIEVDRPSVPCPIGNVGVPAPTAEDECPTRAGRLAAAFRLTRDAAQAWAAVIGEPSADAGCGR